MERLVIPVLTPAAADVIAGLVARPGLDVVGVVVDVGSGVGLDALRDVALAAGAVRCHVVDRLDALATGVLWPALRAGALGVAGEPVLTALSMPVVAETVVEMCRHEQATGVAVWADDPRDRQRLRALLRTLAPTLGLVAVTSGATGAAPTANLWARLEPAGDAAAAPAHTVAPGTADIRVGFERGQPMTLSDVAMTPAELVDSLATIARAHGAGTWTVRADGGEWRVHAPAALALHQALVALTARVFDAPTIEMAATVAETYAGVVRDGQWFSPVRAGLDAFIDRVLDRATGEVRLRVTEGRIEVEA